MHEKLRQTFFGITRENFMCLCVVQLTALSGIKIAQVRMIWVISK